MMRHQVVWAACSVTNPATGEEKVLTKGDMLPDWVTDFTRFVLTTSGAVRVVDGAGPDLEPVEALPEPVRLAEHPPPNQQEPEPADPPAAAASRSGKSK